MTPKQVRLLADSTASILLSHTSHGYATRSLQGVGEITLRDGLIASAAAVGASLRQAWVLRREFKPALWGDAAIDLVVSKRIRRKGKTKLKEIGATELKWIRRTDPANASNRRKDVVKDFIRAAAMYPQVIDYSFVALVATTEAWNALVNTNGGDKKPMQIVQSDGIERWNVSHLKSSPAVRNSCLYLSGKVPITNVFYTELLSEHKLVSLRGDELLSRVWSVRKMQNSKWLNASELEKLFTARG